MSPDLLPAETVRFDSGTPALDLFPRQRWAKAVNRVLREAPDTVLGYDFPQGRPELREALARHLKKTRGIAADPDRILITSGTKQALTLAGQCLLNEKSRVLLEDPSNSNVRKIFAGCTACLIPVPVDEDGLQTALPPAGADLVFVTPSHQFPMGALLPIQRRLELIRFTRRTGCWESRRGCMSWRISGTACFLPT